MSLRRTALALSLLLGTSAQEPHKLHRTQGHLRHHKHHGHHKHNAAGPSQLWSHGQKFELVIPESEDAGLVKLARESGQSENPVPDPTVESQSRPAKVTKTAQEVVDPKLRMQETEKATWANAYAREVRKIQKLQKVTVAMAKATDEPVAKEAVTVTKARRQKASEFEDSVPDFVSQDDEVTAKKIPIPVYKVSAAESQEDEVTPKKIDVEVGKVSAVLRAAADQKSQHEDDQSHSTKQKSGNSNTQAQGFTKIRQELRLAKKKDRQVKALNKHLDAELDILLKSSELQKSKSVNSDEETAKLLQQQTSQLKTMAEQTKTRIQEFQDVAHNAARLASQQAEAMRDAARAEEKKAEEQLQKSKKAELEAEKLDKIALKELRKAESKPKGALSQEKATAGAAED